MNTDPEFHTIRENPYTLPRLLRDSLLNVFFPETCAACGGSVARHQDRGVCEACWKNLLGLRIEPPWCPLCGHPYGTPEREGFHLCGACLRELPPYFGSLSYGYYTLQLRSVIHAFKFEGRQDLRDLLVPLVVSVVCRNWGRDQYDLVVPVPLHTRKQHERGYNQSALLAKAAASTLRVSYSESALRRTRPTRSQAGLTRRQRRENVRGAFLCHGERAVRGKRVLLVDDVMTTGATASSAARALLDAGAVKVFVATLARTHTGME